MTIDKGVEWGRPGRLPVDGLVVHSDAEARAVVEAAKRARQPIPVLGLAGGDLCRTLGGQGDVARLRSSEAITATVDLGSVLADGRIHWFTAHAIARRSWWRGRIIAAMNAQYLGEWDLGPRAHPGDGLIDITDGDLPFAQRFKARSRLSTGTHLPHPGLSVQRCAAAQFEFNPTLDLWLDGVRVGRTHSLSVRAEPEALTVVI